MKYNEAYKEKLQLEAVRELMVEYAMNHTNQAAAELFSCHRNVISKWKNRKLKGLSLVDLPRNPNHIPHKINDQNLIDYIGSYPLKIHRTYV